MVNFLFSAVSESLKEFGLSKLHGAIGFMMVYQSWCRNGDFHPHVHCLIPGGALSKNEEYWLWPEKRNFLFSGKPLSRLFRGKLNALTKDLPEAQAIPKSTWFKEYVVDVKCVGDSMASFKYLAAYTQRGFIGNDRIEDYDGQNVTFRYTDSRTETIKRRTVTALEFMELYLQHVCHAKRISENQIQRVLGRCRTQKIGSGPTDSGNDASGRRTAGNGAI